MDELILSFLEILNKEYLKAKRPVQLRHRNSYSLYMDCRLRFPLTSICPTFPI